MSFLKTLKRISSIETNLNVNFHCEYNIFNVNLLLKHFDCTTYFCLRMHGYSNNTRTQKEEIKTEAETYYMPSKY